MNVKFSKIIPFFTPFIVGYLIFSLGWESQIREDLNVFPLLGMLIFLSLFHFLALGESSLKKGKRQLFVFSLFVLLASFISIFLWIYLSAKDKNFYHQLIKSRIFFIIGFILYILIRISQFMQVIYKRIQNPAFIFAISFFFLVFIGTFLLLLPDATTKGVSFVNALFMATSAVCVTGLTVVDLANEFTFFGQFIILILIQLGGLGILTITSFFGYFFRGNTSFKEGLHMKSLLSGDSLKNITSLAVKIVGFSLSIEFIGAFLLYFVMGEKIGSQRETIFFSIFHSISAFCNAGFSTLREGLYSESIRYHYILQLIMASLFILGGLGFPIVFNFYKYLWLKIKKMFFRVFLKKILRYPINIITLNAKLSIFTTLILLIGGTFFYFFNEYDNSLAEHKGFFGKSMAAFFSSASPRTAGFNVIDLTGLAPATIFFTMLLMWIGASPASTGGGIKTSTFALALLNIFSLIRGKSYLEIYGREISFVTLRYAFSIIVLSFLAIGLGFFIILQFDPNIEILAGLFEVFSAFSTSGLSLGITSELSLGSKLVLIVLMFLGRIGLFNLLLGIFRRQKTQHHRFPKEKILIN